MDFMKMLYDKAIPLISIPGLAMLLYFMPYLKLVPFARWYMDDGWRYVYCIVGSYVGYLLPRRNASIKTKAWIGGVFAFLGVTLAFAYTQISSEPLTEGNKEWISESCFVLFVLTYFSLGFFFSNLGKLPQRKSE